MLSLSGCGWFGSQTVGSPEFFCPVTVSHDAAGQVEGERYSVDRACFKRQTEKVRACYVEIR